MPDYFTSSNHYCPVNGEDSTTRYGGVIRHTFRAIDHSKALECVTNALKNLDCSDVLTVSRFDPDWAFLLGVPAAMILVMCCCCIYGQSKQKPASLDHPRRPLLGTDSPIRSSAYSPDMPDADASDQENDVENGNGKGPDYESSTDSDDEREVISQQP